MKMDILLDHANSPIMDTGSHHAIEDDLFSTGERRFQLAPTQDGPMMIPRSPRRGAKRAKQKCAGVASKIPRNPLCGADGGESSTGGGGQPLLAAAPRRAGKRGQQGPSRDDSASIGEVTYSSTAEQHVASRWDTRESFKPRKPNRDVSKRNNGLIPPTYRPPSVPTSTTVTCQERRGSNSEHAPRDRCPNPPVRKKASSTGSITIQRMRRDSTSQEQRRSSIRSVLDTGDLNRRGGEVPPLSFLLAQVARTSS